jgi:hypothetical protein
MAFENRVLGTPFGTRRDKMVRQSKKLHNEELRNSRFSPNIKRMVKSWRMISAGHIAHMGNKGVYARF